MPLEDGYRQFQKTSGTQSCRISESMEHLATPHLQRLIWNLKGRNNSRLTKLYDINCHSFMIQELAIWQLLFRNDLD
jgi:hypothetical protein